MCTWRRVSGLVFSERNLLSCTKAVLQTKPMCRIGEDCGTCFKTILLLCAEMQIRLLVEGALLGPKAAEPAATVKMHEVCY